jgi:serine/threonine-protein kinase
MAVVYEVLHERLGKRFALKVLGTQSSLGATRLEREARIVAQLRHPHVVDAVDFGGEGDSRYLVMELVEGETLAARLARVGRLPLDEIAAIFLPVCSALAAAHARGIVHRDLKPSNIMLASGAGGRVWPKVLDFGISKLQGASPDPVTRTGVVLGTVSYLSPELARSARDVSGQSDVYTMGTMLFECATGRLPFVGESHYDVMHAIVTQAAPRPGAIAPELPASFDALVSSALERDRGARIASARALGKELLAFADPVTRSLWEGEFEGGADTTHGDSRDEPAGSTLPEEPVAVTTSSPVRGRRARAAAVGLTVAALAIGVVTLVRVRATHSALAASSPSAEPPATTAAPAPVETGPQAAAVTSATAEPSADPPRSPPRPKPVAIEAKAPPHIPSSKPAPAFRRGANGAPILE